jgi:integrase
MQALLRVCGDRKAVYLAAVLTGLRRAELGALVWGDVHLDEPNPFLRVRTATAKNRKEQIVPLHCDLILAFREISPAPSCVSHFVFPRVPTREVFRSDLKKANIPFVDDRGRRADFHALRHTLGTNLGLAGVASRVAQEVMRHSDPKLTNKIYMDVSQLPTAAAINLLPSFKINPVTPTKKHATTAGFSGHSPSSPVTVGTSWEGQETIANTGEGHDLALCVTAGHEKENGAPARTRTYF